MAMRAGARAAAQQQTPAAALCGGPPRTHPSLQHLRDLHVGEREESVGGVAPPPGDKEAASLVPQLGKLQGQARAGGGARGGVVAAAGLKPAAAN